MDDLEAEVAAASEAAAQGLWQLAAERWGKVASRARLHGAHRSAAMCAEQEGECWRRADHAERAERALQFALSSAEPPEDPVACFARLAAVLGERGKGSRALAVARQALHMARQTHSPRLPIALDTLLGLLQGFGSKEEQRPLLEDLRQSAGEGAPSVAFREGQLQRLDGDLDASDATFAGVEALLAGVEGAEVGVAAARMERAEIGMLRGQTAGAVEAFAHAHQLHEGAGRRSLAWRCEVGRIRASVRVGLEPVAPGLQAARAWARGRGLELLAVDLLTAKGLCEVQRNADSARAALEAAAAESEAMGSRLRAGRIHLHLLRYVPADVATQRRWGLLARDALADNVPLHREATTLLAELSGGSDPTLLVP